MIEEIEENESVFDEPILRDYVSALNKKGDKLIKFKGRSISQVSSPFANFSLGVVPAKYKEEMSHIQANK